MQVDPERPVPSRSERAGGQAPRGGGGVAVRELGHPAILSPADARAAAADSVAAVRVLTDRDVRAALPPLTEVVDLAEEALRALAEGRADVPPKLGARTGPAMFAHAMPAALPERGLLGCKWISVVPDNPLHGLPTASGVMVLNDGTTGAPSALLAAGELTAVRTAAVSGACVRALAPDGPVAVLGAGVQALSHTRVLAALGHERVLVWARRRSAVEELAARAREVAPGIRVVASSSREAAVRDAGTVVTALSIGLSDMALPTLWPREDALLLPLDHASSVGPDLAASASVLATDDLRQFDAVRREGRHLGDYPTPTAWTGHLLGGARPEGRVVVQNLGSGVVDLVVADAVTTRAATGGAGRVLDLTGT